MGIADRARLSTALGHEFAAPELLDEALTHPSIRSGQGSRDYDRLEFLGDRVLGLVIAERLLARFGEADAGHLARRYNDLVRRETLAEVAQEVELGDHLKLARSEVDSGGRDKPAILANACEAVIAALYLDGGLAAAAGFIGRYWEPRMAALTKAPKDAKTRLQEWGHARAHEPPTYVVVEQSGPAHLPQFTIEVTLADYERARGSGSSKRSAEQVAAAALLDVLEGRTAAAPGSDPSD
ncbi:MAG: ribonuclease III [Alphaproteobacteria bacterium]|jgi:ribonuclease-3|nr:ribonuclease III [Alphaproteobacteria bacterium]MDP7604168.1 ribonuclease III [Alphaproteobacteria bacterium]HJP23627.1 ribonuclease III [Alphaproteobacteria bacterium]